MLFLCNRIFTAANGFQNIICRYNFFINTYTGKKLYRGFTLLLAGSIIAYIIYFNNSSNTDLFAESILGALMFMLLLMLMFAYDIYKLFISLRWFLFSQIIISCIVFMIIKSIGSDKIATSNDEYLFIGISFVVCCFFSVTANSTVSMTGNTIIAGIASIMLLVGNTLITMMPSGTSFPTYPGSFLGVPVVYTFQQKNQIDFNFATMPILIINGLAATLAALKSYWVKKYNDGQEISWKDFD